ncbi:uncharacterized protein EDB91DRAFT_1161260 [Suillus paluster]|uniref:uncharacterized protein n=1 Tax=Suillus paluster TaxID=48578 RepID=UPI001B86339B|nr:uncharacterized protein EDB91DRAFT_1161260 [Suillus paluster]KAG1728608.1 hypothetical protein EDB91DRAFT_1161260 [Suillus paluster]
MAKSSGFSCRLTTTQRLSFIGPVEIDFGIVPSDVEPVELPLHIRSVRYGRSPPVHLCICVVRSPTASLQFALSITNSPLSTVMKVMIISEWDDCTETTCASRTRGQRGKRIISQASTSRNSSLVCRRLHLFAVGYDQTCQCMFEHVPQESRYSNQRLLAEYLPSQQSKITGPYISMLRILRMSLRCPACTDAECAHHTNGFVVNRTLMVPSRNKRKTRSFARFVRLV